MNRFLRERLIFVRLATICLWVLWFIDIARTGFRRDSKNDPIGVDHLAFYSAAQIIDHGWGSTLYDLSFQAEYQQQVLQSDHFLLDAYRNPPWYALLYRITSWLSFSTSYWIWTAIALLFLWSGILRIRPEKPLSLFILALGFYPVFAAITFGQNSLLSFGILAFVYADLEAKRYRRAGLLAGLLLFKPQLLVGLIVWWCLEYRRYWHCLLGVSITGLFLAAVSCALLPEATHSYLHHFASIARYDAFHYWNLHNPRGFFALIAGDDHRFGEYAGWVIFVLTLGCFIWYWWRSRPELPVIFSVAIFVTLWSSPHTMIYEWAIVLLPATLLWEKIPSIRTSLFPCYALAWLVLFLSTPLAQFLYNRTLDQSTGRGWSLQVSVPLLALITCRILRVIPRRAPANEKARQDSLPTEIS